MMPDRCKTDPPRPADFAHRRWALLAWCALIVLGFGYLVGYSNTPGRAALPPPAWPVESKIEPDSANPTLLMFLHPYCPCSRASLEELSRIIARADRPAQAVIAFVLRGGTASELQEADLWKAAAVIPGARLWVDIGGLESMRFRAATSGEAMLYAANGRLLFHGGITGARGHVGDNRGAAAILSWLNTDQAERATSFVFGCPLADDGAPAPGN
jgi:hypothetical protein